MDNQTLSPNGFLKGMSPQDFLQVGLHQIAYIKPITTQDDQKAFAIHSANGLKISVIDSFENAVALLQDHNLHPVTLH